jgi:hypothetical protein
MMVTEFDAAIAGCREAYVEFQQFASRTDEALYRALDQIYALRYRMHTDTVLRSDFDELLRQHAPTKVGNETLFVVKYIFFPHTLEPGPGHKSDITKASRYAKLVNRALEQNIEPADFLAFARQHGIQRTAVARRGKRCPGRRSPRRGGRQAAPNRQSVNFCPRFVTDIAAPLEPRFYNSNVAAQLAQAVVDAKESPQKISLTMYLTNERAVVTGITARPWAGQFPDETSRITRAAPPVPLPSAFEPRLLGEFQRPGLPQRKRGVSPSSRCV